MTQDERLSFLITSLKNERADFGDIEIPKNFDEKKSLFRALMNLRNPAPISDEFILAQDEFLQEELKKKRVTCVDELRPIEPGIYLWQGDITLLKIGAIVNAANSAALGCFVPGHNCIDNIIHTNAGAQLRLECDSIMKKRGAPLETGGAIITGAYNLPSDFVIHTVGPIVGGKLTDDDREKLAECYRSCLALCEEREIKSIAFCCISTGVFHFPNEEAAKIAVDTARNFLSKKKADIKIVFNVFKDEDYEIYKRLL